jgi:hypothetical protein
VWTGTGKRHHHLTVDRRDQPRPPGQHVLHLILSVLTAGIWIPVWIIVALASGEKRKVIAR